MNDEQLTLIEKLELINNIHKRQNERWLRLRRFHSIPAPMKLKHFFMQKEVDLIRSQKRRLKKLKQMIYG